MPQSLPSRRIRTLHMLGMLLLAVSVFAWGLQYKMSLYATSNNAGASVEPHAKLLSQKERPASPLDVASTGSDLTQYLLQLLTSSTIFLFAAALFVLTIANTLLIRCVPLAPALRRRRFAAQNFFSFRPPPAAFPSH
jgi:hypothetical protein